MLEPMIKGQRERESAHLNKLETIGNLAAWIAHEFNNIITAVIGNVGLVKLLIAEPGKTQDAIAALDDMEKAGTRARYLANRLVTFSRGGTPVKNLSSLEAVLKKAVDSITLTPPIELHKKTAWDLNQCLIDVEQVAVALVCLLDNAIQAMSSGGKLSLTAENVTGETRDLTRLPQGEWTAIRVSDTGEGIESQQFSQIFDPFYTTRSGREDLGLSIAVSIIKQHGGKIGVESEVGRGSTFSVYLPAAGPNADGKRSFFTPRLLGTLICHCLTR